MLVSSFWSQCSFLHAPAVWPVLVPLQLWVLQERAAIKGLCCLHQGQKSRGQQATSTSKASLVARQQSKQQSYRSPLAAQTSRFVDGGGRRSISGSDGACCALQWSTLLCSRFHTASIDTTPHVSCTFTSAGPQGSKPAAVQTLHSSYTLQLDSSPGLP